MPYDLLHKNENDILDGVEVINIDSDDNIEPILEVKDENVKLDIDLAALNKDEEDKRG